MDRAKPNPEEIKDIFKHIFLWFEKWKEAETDKEWEDLIEEARQIRDKYNFRLTEMMIIELERTIESYWRDRKVRSVS